MSYFKNSKDLGFYFVFLFTKKSIFLISICNLRSEKMPVDHRCCDKAPRSSALVHTIKNKNKSFQTNSEVMGNYYSLVGTRLLECIQIFLL